MSGSRIQSETESPAPEVIVEIVDDTPEADRGKPTAPETTEDSDDHAPGEEIESYSKRVQKRIKDLTGRSHAERRAKEQAAREREEAVTFAQKVAAENQRLREQYAAQEAALIEQAKGRTEAQVSQAKRAARDALETGDPDKIVEAQSLLRKYEAEADRLAAYQPAARPKTEVEAPRNETPPPRKVEIPEPDERAKKWAEKNDWFGSNKRMTATAYGIHEELIAEGVDPSGADYYRRLDEGMRETYPKAFAPAEEETPRAPARSPVAPATRSPAQPRTVKLTASQVALARRLNISNEQYAAQMLKDALDG